MKSALHGRSADWPGYLLGLTSSATFGLIPLFSLPVLSRGVPVSTVLMYRFLFAALMVGGISLCRGESLRISRRSCLTLFCLSSLYFFSALLLLEGYRYMPSGVATVLHFSYPTFVVLLMYLFFRQRIQPVQGLAVLLALAGVSLISGIFDSEIEAIPLFAVGMVLLSGLSYAIYIVVLRHARIEAMSSFKLTAYVMGFSAVLFGIYGAATDFDPVLHGVQWGYVLLLALLPTVCANVTLVWAVQRIGSTPTAIMGALEPLTAVLIGTAVLGERLSLGQSIGIGVVLAAVLTLVLAPLLSHGLRRV